jgi:hypothetical protein
MGHPRRLRLSVKPGLSVPGRNWGLRLMWGGNCWLRGTAWRVGADTFSNQPDASSDKSSFHFLCRSVDRRQANFGEQLLECRIAVKADETLVIAKIQHDLVMRLHADGQILERFARVAEPSVGLRHKIG